MQNLIRYSGAKILNSTCLQPPVFFTVERRSPAVDGHSDYMEVGPMTWAVITQRQTLPQGCYHAEPVSFLFLMLWRAVRTFNTSQRGTTVNL